MVFVVREFIRARDPLIRDPLNTYTRLIQTIPWIILQPHWNGTNRSIAA